MAGPRTWPAVLVPSSEDWSIRGGTRSGGQTFEGQEQVTASPTARWKATRTIPCMKPDRVRAARQVIALGRSAMWLVGPCEASRAPWGIDPLFGEPITYAGQQPGAQPPYDRALGFALAADAALNATTLSLTRSRGGPLAPGMTFSIGNRLHTIVALTTPDPADPSTGLAIAGMVGVEIRPWLRAAWSAGTTVEFGRPLGTMRLASDDTGALELQLARLGTLSLELVEAF